MSTRRRSALVGEEEERDEGGGIDDDWEWFPGTWEDEAKGAGLEGDAKRSSRFEGKRLVVDEGLEEGVVWLLL